MHGNTKQTLAMGSLCSVVGVLTALIVQHMATGSDYEWFLLAAPVSAFVTAMFFWWLIVVRKQQYGTMRGALAGAVSGAVAHYVCWYLILVGAAICHLVTGGCTGSLGEAPMNPIFALAGAGVYSGLSLLFFGWITVPAGALIGGILARAQRP